MQSFADFLREDNTVEAHMQPYYVRWVSLFVGYTRREDVDNQSLDDFLRWLSPKYPE